jgi:hypothetical protein
MQDVKAAARLRTGSHDGTTSLFQAAHTTPARRYSRGDDAGVGGNSPSERLIAPAA